MKASRLAAFAALITLGIGSSYADQTNVVQSLNIQLFGVTQGGSNTNRGFVTTSADFVSVDTRRVIAALGTATGNNFSFFSRLVVVTPVEGGFSSIQVRDRGTTVDVTSFFVHQQLTDSVERSFLSTRTGSSFSTDYNIQRFALQDGGGYPALSLHFDVQGFAVENSTTSGSGSPSSDLSINASGSGDRGGSLLILQGSISLRGRTLEVVPDGGGGGVS